MKPYPFRIQTWLLAAAFSLTACGGTGDVQSAPTPPRRGSTAAGTLTTHTTWGGTSCPVSVINDVFVEGPDTPVLTIEAGCEVKFSEGKGLFIGKGGPGALKLAGTPDAPVVLTGEQSLPGAWQGLLLLENTHTEKTELAFATIEFAGSAPALGSVQIRGVEPVLKDVTVRNGASHGIAIESGGLGAGSERITLWGNAGHGVRLPASAVGTLPADLSFTGNGGDIEVPGGVISEPVHWRAQAGIYAITGDIEVRGDETAILTLEAGARLRFSPSAGLIIASDEEKGALVVNGTAEKPVFFLPMHTAVPGSWSGILFRDNALDDRNALTHAIIENAGGARRDACLTLERATVTLRDVTLRGCEGYGLWLGRGALLGEPSARVQVHGSTRAGVHVDASAVHTLPVEGSRYSNNRVGVEIAGGTVSESAAWRAPETPYVISADIFVGGMNRPVLELEPGITLRFREDTGLYIGSNGLPGGLTAIGSATMPITFTAHNQQVKGEWFGIHFAEATLSAESILSHVVVEWAGGGPLGGSVEMTGSSPVIRDSLIWRGLDCGIRLQCTAPGQSSLITGVSYGEGLNGNDAGALCNIGC